jgi:hypothetical protein
LLFARMSRPSSSGLDVKVSSRSWRASVAPRAEMFALFFYRKVYSGWQCG